MAKIEGFQGDYGGLTNNQVEASYLQHGRNILVPEKPGTFWSQLCSSMKEPMLLLLFVTAMIYFFLGEPRDGLIMLIFVFFISGINIFQQWRTDRTLQALKDLSSPRMRVIRNGVIEEIDSRDLTVNDLTILEEGEKVSADCILLEYHDLGVDESTLTGESDVVWKTMDATTVDESAHWRKDRLYAGTTVTQGTAICQVAHIGLNTEYGKIAQDIASAPPTPTPLENQTRALIRYCALIGLLLFVLVFLVSFQHTRHITDSILSGITLAMAMIPEEFPVILTVFLAMGAWRLARNNALVRRIPSVETLGSVSVLCVDKTGTLTMNQMTVQEVLPHQDYTPGDIAYWGGLACETEPFDPMEKAILQYTETQGINRGHLFGNQLLHEYPFNTDIKMMGHVWSIDGRAQLAAKGSPESILPLCGLEGRAEEEVHDLQESLAEKGYRVIAIARNVDLTTIAADLTEVPLELVGLIGLADPPRPGVPEAVKECNQAGVRVVMITGDNGTTARSIAEQIGMKDRILITGPELESMSDEELCTRVKSTGIFSRVIPRHKMRIVRAFKDNGEIVAMTGDGVNDAPALKYADIGIAMGQRGTGVAKEAADMILLDDNFATIVNTIKDGRRIYDNIKKAIGYVFVVHIPIAAIALLTPLLHLPLMLLPIHVVLLELIIDPTCSIVFERQPAEKNIMQRPPRSLSDPLVGNGMIVKAVLQGATILAASLGSYAFFIQGGYGESLARTFALAILFLSNILLVYVNQSETQSALTGFVNFVRDPVLYYINGGILLGLMTVIYLPIANQYIKTTPLTWQQLLVLVALATGSTLWWEAVKWIRRIRSKDADHLDNPLS